METMWQANSMPPASDSMSPSPMVKSAVSDTRPMPAMHTNAAIILKISGLRRDTIQNKNGTMTQYMAVKNAFLPGVVVSIPAVWSEKARKRKTPITAPDII